MDVSEEKTGTLRAEAHGHAPIVQTIAGNIIGRANQNGGHQLGIGHDVSPTLNTVDRHAIYQKEVDSFTDVADTLCASYGTKWNGNASAHNGSLFALAKSGHKTTLKDPQIVSIDKSVRRLTPTECERLQGLPDGYTDIEYHGKPAPDSRRYKAIGNGMAVPCSDFIMRRIAEVSNGQNEGHD
jgi:DNA (cytosine-5)-methyltransferase 1